MGSVAHMKAVMGQGEGPMAGVSTNPVGNGVAKSAGLRGVERSTGGVHKPDGWERRDIVRKESLRLITDRKPL
jgi:hypothetical protein